MEFLLFLIITIIVGVSLYIFFSMRMSAAIEKIKTENPAQKELIEHSLRIVQDLNSYIEEMHEIRSNYYQLVRESRSLIERLETAKGKGAKKISGKKEKPVGSKKFAGLGSDSGAKEESTETADDSPEYLNRLVENQGPDTFEVSNADPIRARSKPVPEPGNVSRMMDSLGGWLNGLIAPSQKSKSANKQESPAQNKILPADRVKLPSADATMDTDYSTAENGINPGVARADVKPEDWIRSLVKNGMSPADVSKLTGRSLAEVELISSLPPLQPSPRRTRIG